VDEEELVATVEDEGDAMKAEDSESVDNNSEREEAND
jgi:hypothetical protein